MSMRFSNKSIFSVPLKSFTDLYTFVEIPMMQYESPPAFRSSLTHLVHLIKIEIESKNLYPEYYENICDQCVITEIQSLNRLILSNPQFIDDPTLNVIQSLQPLQIERESFQLLLKTALRIIARM